MPSDDDEPLPACPCKKDLPNIHMLECDQCETYWHTTCCGLTGLTQMPVNKLIANHWKCPRCFKFSEDIPDVKPKEETNLSEDTISSIVSLVTTTVVESLKAQKFSAVQTDDTDSDDASEAVEGATGFATVTRNKRCRHKQSNNIQKAIQEQREEEILIDKKKDNLIIYGMPESEAADKKAEMLEDYRKLKLSYQGRVEIEKEDLTNITRLGTKGTSIRPIQITLANQNKRKQLLTNNKELKLLENNISTQLYVSPDRTKQQREADKLLRAELKERKKTDPNLVIRNNKIVTFRPAAQETQTWASLFE